MWTFFSKKWPSYHSTTLSYFLWGKKLSSAFNTKLKKNTFSETWISYYFIKTWHEKSIKRFCFMRNFSFCLFFSFLEIQYFFRGKLFSNSRVFVVKFRAHSSRGLDSYSSLKIQNLINIQLKLHTVGKFNNVLRKDLRTVLQARSRLIDIEQSFLLLAHISYA